MVARFVNGKGIRGMLHYNENKVAAGEAKLLLASGFAGDASQYSLAQKLKRFEHLTVLNSRVQTNAIHITLNFDPQDRLTNEQLQQISLAYMERIGFGDQPFLVYLHNDAAHTHVHIATVNIRPDGSRIDTHGIGWKLSEPARQQIEKEFELVVAKGRNQSNELAIKPANLEKALYGKSLTKRAITNVVNAVMNTYAFTSLAEFNAVLQQFNVRTDRGAEGTLMHQKRGLLYSLVNARGEAVGVPIKASAIYNKPTLVRIEKMFAKNQEKRKALKEPLKAAIDRTIGKYTHISKGTLIRELQQQHIATLFRTNEEGMTYGVTYIDHRGKAVFNGSDLGKAYSAKGLLERLSPYDKALKQEIKRPAEQHQTQEPARTHLQAPTPTHYLQLALAKNRPEALPSLPKKKKRKKKGQQPEQSPSLEQ